jgi:hypothetical protein
VFWGADNALKNLCRQLLLGDDCDFSQGYREPVEGSLGGVCILPDLPWKYKIEKNDSPQQHTIPVKRSAVL